MKSYAKNAAGKHGGSERTFQRIIRRAENIAPDIRDAIKGRGFDDDGRELDYLAAMTHDQQRAAWKLVKEGKALSFSTAREKDRTHRNTDINKAMARLSMQLLRILSDDDERTIALNSLIANAKYGSPAEVQDLRTQLEGLSVRPKRC